MTSMTFETVGSESDVVTFGVSVFNSAPSELLSLESKIESVSLEIDLIISIVILSPSSCSQEILPLFKLPSKNVYKFRPKGQYTRSPEIVI